MERIEVSRAPKGGIVPRGKATGHPRIPPRTADAQAQTQGCPKAGVKIDRRRRVCGRRKGPHGTPHRPAADDGQSMEDGAPGVSARRARTAHGGAGPADPRLRWDQGSCPPSPRWQWCSRDRGAPWRSPCLSSRALSRSSTACAARAAATGIAPRPSRACGPTCWRRSTRSSMPSMPSSPARRR